MEMPKTINLEQVDHLMQVSNLGNLNKKTAARYAQYIESGQTMLAHNCACTILRRITKNPDGTLEVGLLKANSLPYTVATLLEMAAHEGNTVQGKKYLALARKFIRKNKSIFQGRHQV
jgi:hypothetical protein